MPTEIELKLSVDPRFTAQVAGAPVLRALASGAPTLRTLRSIYFDTPENSLSHAGIALRVRRVNGQWVQTLKQEGKATAGLHQREEAEHVVRGPEVDLSKIDDLDVYRRLAKWHGSGTLGPRFETVFRRRAWQLRTAAGDEIECALDKGEIRALDSGRTTPICEVELELKSGSPAALFGIARELAAAAPLMLEDRSKAERGYALLRRATGERPAKAETIAVTRDDTAGAVFGKILGSGLAHLHRHRQAALATSRYDPEHVHQMRVAIRRLRTGFALFSQLAPDLKTHPVVAELKYFAGVLGNARELDILLVESLPPLAGALEGESGMQQLALRGTRARAAARRETRLALSSPRYLSMVLAIGELAVGAEPIPGLAEPISQFAVRALSRYQRRLRRSAKGLAGLAPMQRHHVRIMAKKLRYSAEYFGALFPKSKVDKFLGRFAMLQDALGALNDLAMMRSRVASLAGGAGEPLSRAEGIVVGWCVANEQRLLKKLDSAWSVVKRSETFWPAPDSVKAASKA